MISSLLNEVICSTTITNRKVAIIGGGISGLSCAKRLKDLGNNNVIVFDTGKNNVGGRCSSRFIKLKEKDNNNKDLIYDHSAQFMTIHDNSDFKKELQMFINDKLILEWNGSIKIINSNNEIDDVPDNVNTKRYVGCNGMMTLSDILSKELSIRRPCWISNMIKQPSGKWKLMSYRDDLGEFDVVVIAHNGKCADRLISTAPSCSKIHERLKVSFSPTLPRPDVMRKMILSSLFVGTFAIKKGIIPNFGDALIIDNKVSPLSWICCTSRKISQDDHEYESYTIISTREFASNNKVPQESIPIEKELEVKSILLRGFESVLGLTLNSIEPIHFLIQLWGAAIPLNRYSSPYVYDSSNNIGICGDWMNSSQYSNGPNIETAFMSGFKLANNLIDIELKDTGLSDIDCFEALNNHPLGDILPNMNSNNNNVVITGPSLNSLVSLSSTNNRNRNRNKYKNKSKK